MSDGEFPQLEPRDPWLSKSHDVVDERPITFKGSYLVLFSGDPTPSFLQLDGATLDGTGIPIYVYLKDGTAFNWLNIVAVRKVTPKPKEG